MCCDRRMLRKAQHACAAALGRFSRQGKGLPKRGVVRWVSEGRLRCQSVVLDSMLFFIAFKVSCVSPAIFLLMIKFNSQSFGPELE